MNIRALHIVFIVVIGLLLFFCTNTEQGLKVMSFNIRYDNPGDGINAWNNRASLVFSFLNEQQADIIGFQEVQKHQLDQLSKELETYDYVGVGRDDGKEQGEFVPVFYNKNTYELLASSSFWLSETPEIAGSMSWGAVYPRVVTWVALKDKQRGYIFYVFNTHFSHVSAFARNKSSILLLNKINTIAGEAPVILCGDFNAQPSERMYKTITDNWTDHHQLRDSRLLPSIKTDTNQQTFNGFNSSTDKIVIDHIFVNGFFDVNSFKTSHIKKEHVYISDHYPIVADLSFRLNEKENEGEEKRLTQTTQTPIIIGDQLVFKDSLLIEIQTQGHLSEIYYSLDNTQPDTTSLLYSKPFYIDKSCVIKAVAIAENRYPSADVHQSFIKSTTKHYQLKEVLPEADNEYSLPNYKCLSDDKIGNISELRDGSWSSFNGVDVDFLFEMRQNKTINKVYISGLSKSEKWIVEPSKIELKTSNDGITYKTILQQEYSPSFDTNKVNRFVKELEMSSTAKFLKISIFNGGMLPASHNGSGNPSWLFIDEIVIQ